MERLNEITRDISHNNQSDIDQSRYQYSLFTNENINSLKCYYQGCDFRGVRKSQLLAHLRTHANERRFKCTHPGCEQRFAKRPYLVAHLRTHTDFWHSTYYLFQSRIVIIYCAPPKEENVLWRKESRNGSWHGR
ncbi:Zinc finger, C2H2 domain-containing protein [Rozella allomycis CSF55]|uniref:Zinc finger, C2H2 domain-containing protein n=1 Tax=Rozella allomycis (strain CSF55) TaxID=988480 RepID=A0A075ASU7_ROZAC|nr:Zinc finger, C2H2 domain-containing protein [Rozella allomycis CSF55]|eukprot:EPZ33343.1 Zinc finger, C2H2 domain-containing protein [Rozella allomycis CSF55]